ncbi:MAG: PEGA domain-containing protein [Planctomycetaceae bacterium]
MMADLRDDQPSQPDGGVCFRRSSRLFMLLVACVVCFSQTGCVFRRMTVRSDPPGALVTVDGEEKGYTPCTFDFLYYGTREITLMMPGYETLTTMQKVPAPWYQYPVVEFFADNLSPAKITNRHEFSYTMQPQVIVPTDELLDRANSHRSESQIGR